MEICAAVGDFLAGLSLILTLAWFVGSFFKNVGTWFSLAVLVLYAGFPLLCLWMERAIFDATPQAWGVVFLPIVLNLDLLFLQYIHFQGSMILGKKYIYRVGHGLILKRYPLDQIKKCTAGSTSGVVPSRVSRRKVTTFNIRVHFRDGTRGEFSTEHKDSPKARYFLETIRAQRKK